MYHDARTSECQTSYIITYPSLLLGLLLALVGAAGVVVLLGEFSRTPHLCNHAVLYH
jgi:hypothetical protein